MSLFIRLYRYLRPSTSTAVLIVIVSIMTSFTGIASIYSILPLLNTVFYSNNTIDASISSEIKTSEEKNSSISINYYPFINTDKLKDSINDSFSKAFYSKTKTHTLFNVCLFLIASFAIKNIFAFLNTQLLFRIKTKAIKSLRDDVFGHIIEMHLDYFNKNRVGNLMTLVYNDVQAVNDTISLIFINLIQNPFLIIIYIATLLIISWKLTLLTFITSLIIFIVIRFMGNEVNRLSVNLRIKMGDMFSLLQEKLNGIKVIKTNAFETIEFDRFQTFTGYFSKLDIKIGMLSNIIAPMNETLFITTIAIVLWLGGHEVFNGNISSAELIFFIFTLYSIMSPIKELGDLNTRMAVGKASATRLFELLDTKSAIVNGTLSINRFSSQISFENVSFRYNNEPCVPNVIDNVSFEINKGEIVALVGHSGSGKSTLVDLLLRFYDVDRGRITIDGVDIREYDVKQLRKIIGVVSQEVILFNDTIEENIAYGANGEIMQEKIIDATVLANAHTFIEEKPMKYKTQIGDRGIQLSGGQRQRLAIARALVKNPDILIFDEATSALDNESEKVVQNAIDQALTNRTALVVAHRLSTVRNADRIIVLEGGRVIEMGNHEQLIKLEGVYCHLYDIQYSGKKHEKDSSLTMSISI